MSGPVSASAAARRPSAPTPGRRGLLAGGIAVSAAPFVVGHSTAEAAGPAGRPSPAGAAGTWSRLPDLPPNRVDWHPAAPVGKSYWTQLGLAGPIAGSHRGHLLVGGGANFPEPALTSNRPTTLGKVYWNELFVLRPGATRWSDPIRLPDAIAYPACVSTPYGVLVIGGEGFRGGPSGTGLAPAQKFADVFLLRADGTRSALPDLPRPMSYAVAGLLGSTVFVAEGPDFFSLDLARPDRGWTALPPWPGPPRSVAVGVAADGRFHLLSGRAQLPDKSWRFYTDVYAYDPRRARWSRLPDLPFCVTAGLAHPTRGGFLVLGGDKDLARWNLIQHHTALRDAAPPGSPTWTEHNNVITWTYDHHTGFNPEILQYTAGRWKVVGHFPGPPQVTTPAVPHANGLAVLTGEIRPGVRTATNWHFRP
ncbi:Kelch repeat-containing protein [Kribbella flavida DSM 17836]|uniref:Kelch repeat-containing protein n=1 Tax=Kribbella flavida (strain DSM 17836 / JCM 10339 / NBRC 14399) TaxID=479435 RepID=D2PRS7_KRIFD|nr:Kelch repeat-containing protein [Kribbella flavida]ADB29257.1 Kelch repeat-containing protein [Kribbella flavida DSM 17836]